MIEKFIRNDLSLKRWRRFKSSPSAMISIWILLAISFFSFTAEFWANNRPIVMKYQEQIFFPVVKEYHPSVFGLGDVYVMDYRQIEFDPAKGDWAAWPLVQWDAFESNQHVDNYPAPPSKMNWMGTDDRGRDVLARLLYGFRYSLGFALGVWFLSYLVGVIAGAISGFYGGTYDIIGSRVVEVIETTPVLLLLITLISIFSPSLGLLIAFTVFFDWTGIFHQMRGQFLQLRRRDFVEAARALGATDRQIIFKHILPNGLTPIVTFSPFIIAANIYNLAILDFLGFGLQAPTPSWGELMAQAQKYFTVAEWLVWFPCGALVVTMTALILIGQAVRDAYDSRTFVGKVKMPKLNPDPASKGSASGTKPPGPATPLSESTAKA